MAAEYDFAVWRGAQGVEGNSAGLEFIYEDEDSRQPVNLTGVVVVFRLFVPRQPAPVLVKSSANGAVTVNAVAGHVIVPFSIAEIAALGARSVCEYELSFDRSGVVSKEMAGRVAIRGRA